MKLSSSAKTLFKILGIIFICENIVMLILSQGPQLSVLTESLFDSAMLSVFALFPMWLFIIKPSLKEARIQEAKSFHSKMNQNLNIIFTNMFEGVIVQNNLGEIVFHNQAALDILGLTEDQMVRLTSYDPNKKLINEDGSELHGDDHPSMIAMVSGCKVIGKVMGIQKPSGELRWLSISSVPIFENNAINASRVVSTFQDITEQKK